MKIYTKTGDKGETSLFTGKRVPKDDCFMHALGTIDECNSAIGLSLAHLPNSKEYLPYKTQLIHIQHALFDLGAAVATPPAHASASQIKKTRFDSDSASLLEELIDAMEEELPPLKNFILPGGHPSAAHLHLARSICRRAERHCIPLNMHGAITDHALIFLNRLSDYLFVAARMINHLSKTPETTWEHHAGKE